MGEGIGGSTCFEETLFCAVFFGALLKTLVDKKRRRRVLRICRISKQMSNSSNIGVNLLREVLLLAAIRAERRTLAVMATRRVSVLSVVMLLVLVSLAPNLYDSPNQSILDNYAEPREEFAVSQTGLEDYDEFSKGNFSGVELSNISLSVILDDVRSTVAGNLTLDYYNGDSLSFSSIPFHLYPVGMMYADRQGGIQILSVTTTGPSPVALSHSIEPHGQIMWVNLPTQLIPGNRTSFQIAFVTTLPDGRDRANSHGFDLNQSRIYTVSSAYPMPCVYDEADGWNTDLYVEFGDPFYHDMAFHDLFVEVPNNMVVAATGELVDSQSDGTNTTYHYNAGLPVREVTFSASRYYQVDSIQASGVNITSYFLSSSRPEWETDFVEWSRLTLILLNDTYGIYPYSTLNIVEQHGFYGGMEYPCQVYITNLGLQLLRSGQRPPWYLRLLVVHEVAHEWWSQLVGTDAIDWGFLDEGLTCWSHSYYGEVYHGNWEYFQYYRYTDTTRTFYLTNGIDTALNLSNYDRPELVGYVDYTKTPLILEKLRMEIGHDDFIAGLSDFFKKSYFGIGTLPDLQESLEQVVGRSLDWFFLPYFDNPRLPNYSFASAVYDPSDSTLTVTIEDTNEDVNPYPYSQRAQIRVFGSAYLAPVNDLDLDAVPERTALNLTEETVWINGTTTLTYAVSGIPDEVRLIYEDYLLTELVDLSTEYLATQGIQILGRIDVVLLYGGALASVIAVIVFIAVDDLRKGRKT
ncbi:MAG: M1 family metallopeptidase [Candidatus Thorarchaeota archaeon]